MVVVEPASVVVLVDVVAVDVVELLAEVLSDNVVVGFGAAVGVVFDEVDGSGAIVVVGELSMLGVSSPQAVTLQHNAPTTAAARM